MLVIRFRNYRLCHVCVKAANNHCLEKNSTLYLLCNKFLFRVESRIFSSSYLGGVVLLETVVLIEPVILLEVLRQFYHIKLHISAFIFMAMVIAMYTILDKNESRMTMNFFRNEPNFYQFERFAMFIAFSPDADLPITCIIIAACSK